MERHDPIPHLRDHRLRGRTSPSVADAGADWSDRGRGRGRGGRPPVHGHRRRGNKARRGDVRAALLALLVEEPQHGYQLMQQLTDRSGGVWRPSPGSVYPTLAQLEDEGLVTSTRREGRKVFAITAAGRDEVEQRPGPAPWEEVGRSGTALEVKPLVLAVRQVLASGTPDQIERAGKLLNETRRSLYLLLAEDPD